MQTIFKNQFIECAKFFRETKKPVCDDYSDDQINEGN